MCLIRKNTSNMNYDKNIFYTDIYNSSIFVTSLHTNSLKNSFYAIENRLVNRTISVSIVILPKGSR